MNYADCTLVSDKNGQHCIVSVTSRRPDQKAGCYYTLHDPKGGIVGSGVSEGWDGGGGGSALSAMKNGRAAARRWLARKAKQSVHQKKSA